MLTDIRLITSVGGSMVRITMLGYELAVEIAECGFDPDVIRLAFSGLARGYSLDNVLEAIDEAAEDGDNDEPEEEAVQAEATKPGIVESVPDVAVSPV